MVLYTKVWEKAIKDKKGLEKYFKQNKKNYAWSEPRYRGFVAKCKDEVTAKSLKKAIKKLNPDSVSNYIRKHVNNAPAKMEYAVNDDFDCKGLKLLVEYANGDSEIISDGYEVVNDFSNEGKTDVRVTYEGYDVLVSVMVMYALGDINRDGPVDSKDVMRLMRYLAGYDVDVVEAALDVNGDGFVNSKDTTHLMRYLAGWNVEIH